MTTNTSYVPENFRSEIRGAVNALLGLTDLLLDTPLDVVQREYVSVLRSTADRLLRIGGDVAPDEDSRPLSVEPIDLREILTQVADLGSVLAAERGLVVTPVVDGVTNLPLLGDRRYIEHGLMSMVKACISAPGVSGLQLCADTSRMTHVDAIVHAVLDGARTEELREHLASAERYGGTLCIEERSGGLALSFAAPVQSATDAVAASGKRRVLLAEDAADNQYIVRAFLRGETFELEVVGSGTDALDRVKAAAYDIVLMDLEMPGMGGMEATGAIREWERATGRARVPIIALTARCGADEVTRCLTQGFSGFLAKPVSKAALLSALRAYSATVQ